MNQTIKLLFKNSLIIPSLLLIVAAFIIIGIVIEHPEVIPGKASKHEVKTAEKKIFIPTPTDIVEPTVEVVEDNKDPIVKCQLMECGTIEMKSSQCRLSGCCVLGNQYKVMTDQAECTRLQKEYYSKNLNNTQNLPSQKDLILKNAQNNANKVGFDLCIEQTKMESDKCFDNCMGVSNEGSSACRQAADGLGWTTEKFSECLAENSSIHDSCTDKCLSDSQSKGRQCSEKYKF